MCDTIAFNYLKYYRSEDLHEEMLQELLMRIPHINSRYDESKGSKSRFFSSFLGMESKVIYKRWLRKGRETPLPEDFDISYEEGEVCLDKLDMAIEGRLQGMEKWTVEMYLRGYKFTEMLDMYNQHVHFSQRRLSTEPIRSHFKNALEKLKESLGDRFDPEEFRRIKDRNL